MKRKKTSKTRARVEPGPGIAKRIDRLEELEKRIDESIERKLFELKSIAYISLFLCAVLVALVLGILLRAIGI